MVILSLEAKKHSNLKSYLNLRLNYLSVSTAKNVMKQKQFHKGILQLVQEGAIQYYKTLHTEEVILGAVGQLQFEVFETPYEK
ncbi:Peptide chain release factor 3 [Ureibacillus acetophenoni]